MLYVHLLMLENQISAARRTERESISENSYVNPLFLNNIGFSLTLLYTFPLVLTWRIFQTINASLVGNHFLYSHDLIKWLSSISVRRNQMLVTLRICSLTELLVEKWSSLAIRKKKPVSGIQLVIVHSMKVVAEWDEAGGFNYLALQTYTTLPFPLFMTWPKLLLL